MALPNPPPPFSDDCIGEILRRLPPDEPACLVRASIVCTAWRLLISEPGFLRRYREHHRTPPVLGFLHNSSFILTTAADPPLSPAEFECFSWVALDCRHGRVLLHTTGPIGLVVWDPITGDQQRLPEEPDELSNHLTGAVLCAVNSCDHTDCRGGPFLVVFVRTVDEDVVEEEDVGATWMSVYSSETGAWSAPASIRLGPISRSRDVMGSSLLAGNALHFLLEDGRRILKYDLGGHDLSVMNTPPLRVGNMALVKAEDGGLGAAGVEGYSLHLWSWRGARGWVQGRIIELDMMLPMDIGDPSTNLLVIGSSEDANTVFISANAWIFSVELKSNRIRKVCGSGSRNFQNAMVPYASFYTPDYGRLQPPVAEDAMIH